MQYITPRSLKIRPLAKYLYLFLHMTVRFSFHPPLSHDFGTPGDQDPLTNVKPENKGEAELSLTPVVPFKITKWFRQLKQGFATIKTRISSKKLFTSDQRYHAILDIAWVNLHIAYSKDIKGFWKTSPCEIVKQCPGSRICPVFERVATEPFFIWAGRKGRAEIIVFFFLLFFLLLLLLWLLLLLLLFLCLLSSLFSSGKDSLPSSWNWFPFNGEVS